MARKKKVVAVEPNYVAIKRFCTALKCAVEIAAGVDCSRDAAMHGVVLVRLPDHCRGGGLHIAVTDGHRVCAFALEESKETPWRLERMRDDGPDLVWISVANAKIILAHLADPARDFPLVELTCEASATEIVFRAGDMTLATAPRQAEREKEYPAFWQLLGEETFARAIGTRLSAEYLRQTCVAAKSLGNGDGVALTFADDYSPVLCTFTQSKGFALIMPVRP